MWLRGAKPSAAYSVVDSRLVNKLDTGQGINESRMDGEIGGFTFNRIPNNVSRLVVKGMNTIEDIDSVNEDEFASVTNSGDVEEDLAGEA